MIPSTLRFPLVLPFAILIVTATSEEWSTELDSLIRAEPSVEPSSFSLPELCEAEGIEEVIVPAVKCGCFAYRDYYETDPQWGEGILEPCLAFLGNKLQDGFSSCLTAFTTDGEIMFTVLNEFFSEARDTCVAQVLTPTDYPARYISAFGEGASTRRLQEEFVNHPAIRLDAEVTGRHLLDFCLVVGFSSGWPLRKIYRKCCPARRNICSSLVRLSAAFPAADLETS